MGVKGAQGGVKGCQEKSVGVSWCFGDFKG